MKHCMRVAAAIGLFLLVVSVCLTGIAEQNEYSERFEMYQGGGNGGYYYTIVYRLYQDGTAAVTKINHVNTTVRDPWGFSWDREIVIPETVDGHTVTQIGLGEAVFEEGEFHLNHITFSVTIPESVISIGSQAFSYCPHLKEVNIPASVTTIDGNPFGGCPNLKIFLAPDNTVFTMLDGVLYSKPDKRLVYYPETREDAQYVIPNGIKTIGAYAFELCGNLKNITIPDSVTEISKGAFSGCFNLTAIIIPDSVTTIESNVFAYCVSLTSVTIPNSVTSIGSFAFNTCVNLARITLPDSIKTISDRAFLDCTNLTNVTIPDGVTRIGDCAFCCSNLYGYPTSYSDGISSITSEARQKADRANATITIPNSVVSIGINAFGRKCEYWPIIILSPDHPALEIIDDVLFSKPDKRLITCLSSFDAESYSIPEGTETIADYAFYNCRQLSSITIPASVTEIGEDSFYLSSYYSDKLNRSFTVSPKSFAEQYCKDNKYIYNYINSNDDLDWLND